MGFALKYCTDKGFLKTYEKVKKVRLMKNMQTYKQSSLLLLLTALSMGLASCFPDSRPQQGPIGNGLYSGGRGVEIGGDGINGNNTLNNGLSDPNANRTVTPEDPNQEQAAKGLMFTKRTKALWKIACENATRTDLKLKDPTSGNYIVDESPLNQFHDADNDGMSDECERFLAYSPNFAPTNPQNINGYLVSAVKLSPSILQGIALDAATFNADANNKVKYREAWNKLKESWQKDKNGRKIPFTKIKNPLSPSSENTRVWLGRAMCALEASSGRLKNSDSPNSSDSGGIVKVIYRKHMATPGHHIQMEPNRTLSSLVYGNAGTPDEEYFAYVQGGMDNALIHNAFFEGSDRFLTGPVDNYVHDDDDILYIAEASLTPKENLTARLVQLDEVGNVASTDVKSAFLATYGGDTVLSTVDLQGFSLNLPTLNPALLADIHSIQKSCLTNNTNNPTQTTLRASDKPIHFSLSSFYLGKQSRGTFFRENIMVQYVKTKHYQSSSDGIENRDKAASDRFTEYEKVPAEQAENVYELLPQNIAVVMDQDPDHEFRILTPFLPDAADLYNIVKHHDLSGSAYWARYDLEGKTLPDLLSPVDTAPSGGSLTFPDITAVLDDFFYHDKLVDPESDAEEAYAGDGGGYPDPEEAAWAEEEDRGLDA